MLFLPLRYGFLSVLSLFLDNLNENQMNPLKNCEYFGQPVQNILKSAIEWV